MPEFVFHALLVKVKAYLLSYLMSAIVKYFFVFLFFYWTLSFLYWFVVALKTINTLSYMLQNSFPSLPFVFNFMSF